MRFVVPCVLFALLTSVGCLPNHRIKPEDKAPPQVPYRSEKAAPVVTASSINEKNAAQKARELREELERASKERTQSTD